MKRKIIILTIIAIIAVGLAGTLLLKVTGGNSLEKKLELANKYIEEGNYEEAIIAFQAAIKIDENNIEARVGMAKAYIELNNYQDAENILREAIGIDETLTFVWSELIALYERIEKLPVDIKNLVQEALLKTGDKLFNQWIKDHTPQAPIISHVSGSYEKELDITFNNIKENEKVFYTLDGTEPNKESTIYTKSLYIGEGEWTLNVFVTNDYELSMTTKYDYTVSIPKKVVEFQDKELERMIKETLDINELDRIYNTDIKDIVTIEINGPYMYLEKKLRDITENYGYSVKSYGENDYLVNEEWKTERGNITSLVDFAIFDKLDRLEVNFQNDLSELEGIESITQIVDLSLGSNHIKNIGKLAKLNKLKYLRISSNQIEDINALGALVHLNALYAHYNRIENINVLGNLTGLDALWLSDNKISDISVLTNLKNLSRLTMNNNQVADISPINALNKLEYLLLSSNKIKDVKALKNLNELEELWLHNNQIKNIHDLEQLAKLQKLRLNNNQITDIGVLENLTQLTKLDLGENLIKNYLPLKKLTNLQELELDGDWDDDDFDLIP